MSYQLTANIYLKSMTAMKKTLDLVAFKMDRRTNDFKYAKEEIMNFVYGNLLDLFKQMEKEGIIEKCQCKTTLRQGYKNCICKGSGYKNIIKGDK